MISNRDWKLLEIAVSQTKRRTEVGSNRDKIAGHSEVKSQQKSQLKSRRQLGKRRRLRGDAKPASIQGSPADARAFTFAHANGTGKHSKLNEAVLAGPGIWPGLASR